MRKSRFTEAQIIGMIKEQEAGMPTAEVCRRHGLSPATFYKLKAKYGGMDVSDAHRLKSLADENAKVPCSRPRPRSAPWLLKLVSHGFGCKLCPRFRERAQLPGVRIHDLRHTYASNAVSSGMPIQMVGRLLGHTQLQTTMRYAHLADDPVRRAAEENAERLNMLVGFGPSTGQHLRVVS